MVSRILLVGIHLPGERGRLGWLRRVHQSPVLLHLAHVATAIELVADPAVVLLRGATELPHFGSFSGILVILQVSLDFLDFHHTQLLLRL